MNAKIILAAVSFSLALATLQPVLAGPKAVATNKVDATNEQTVTRQPAGLTPFRGDLHVYLKSF